MTPERLERITGILNKRQPDLTVVMDQLYKAHNLSAIARTCDAFAIQDVHYVWPESEYRLKSASAAGSDNWVTVNSHPDIQTAILALKSRGFIVCAAHLTDEAIDYRDYDYTRPTALLLGAEWEGVSDSAASLVDQHLIIPMCGMVQSLNVSVAAGIILSEALRQRQQAGLLEKSRLPDERYQQLLFEWCQPAVASLCQKQGIPYPQLDAEGELIDPQDFSRQVNQPGHQDIE
jgi:tRNA (guanosine-2'-O-)-methyltransferase